MLKGIAATMSRKFPSGPEVNAITCCPVPANDSLMCVMSRSALGIAVGVAVTVVSGVGEGLKKGLGSAAPPWPLG